MRRSVLDRIVCMLVVLGAATTAHAQVEVGTVAAVSGRLEVQRAGTWQPNNIGGPVFAGDRLRTGASDQAKIVFRDETVLDLAPGTEIALDTDTFDPGAHRFQKLLRLTQGKIRAWVSEYYHEPRARYELETPTAVAGVRGTEFIALYAPASEFTDIVGLADQVDVTPKLALIGGAVTVGPQFFTRVQKGRFPTAPQRLDAAQLDQYLQGLDLIGTGRRDGLNILHPALAGRILGQQDLPAAAGEKGPAAPPGLVVGPPQEFLAQQLSPDVRTNTQPLLDFKLTPPGQAPSGTVKVGF